MAGAAHVDVMQIGRGAVRIPKDQHADAHAQRAGHGHFMSAHQRRVQPAQLAGGEGGEFTVDIGGGGKQRRRHLIRAHTVQPDHQRQHFTRAAQDLLARVAVHCRCAAYPSANNRHRLISVGK